MPIDAPGTDAGPADAGRFDGGTLDAGPDLPRSCVSPDGADTAGTNALDDALGRASVTIEDAQACLRTYQLFSTAARRDDLPASPRTVTERGSTLRSGHDLFDALYALALEEARESSVSSIRDGAFLNGTAVPCPAGGCYQTGRLWTYVWTRDTAYSVDLGLAALDPARARASLEFKLSERRGGGGEQIVQDTGSGGSYPVSSDRVVWALGAWTLLAHLEGAERIAFRDRAYGAITNTIEHDRAVVFDTGDGLYSGEQSFLDWREQSYPEWTADDVAHIAQSKALSTNLLHLRAIEIASDIAQERGDVAARDRYRGWADALRARIRERFWIESAGLYSTFATTLLDPSPVRRWDLLGSALAILTGVADTAQAERILSSYPHYLRSAGPGAAPVMFPQSQLTAIYHNRAEWPFVTAYWLRAATRADHDGVADRMVQALVRGAALNLSNMENLEAATGAPYVEDGIYSGPVVNSQRQLWSVAGYVSMVHHSLFGLHEAASGLEIAPYVTRGLRNGMFAGTNELGLNDFPWHGRTITVVLHLPAAGGEGGSYAVGEVRLNGVAIGGAIEDAMLEDRNRVDVVLADDGSETQSTLTARDPSDWRAIFAPRTPRITSVSRAGSNIAIAISANGEDTGTLRFTVYRDEVAIAEDLPGTTASYTDTGADASRSPCYAVEACFVGSGNCSHHSPASCWWGDGGAAITTIGASAMTNAGGSGSSSHGRFHYEPWGDPGDSLTVASFRPVRTGPHLLQVTYGNGAGPINTGITCAIKRIVVEDTATGAVVAQGALVMPHLGTWDRWAGSSFVRATLDMARTYRIVIRGDDEMVNMSSFAHFEAYTGGLGGQSGTFNRVNIAELKVLAL